MRRLLAACLLALPAIAQAALSVVDDAGRTVTLTGPAHRIVSLAPHATELLFAAGAGPHIAGVVEYSDFPPEAKRLPSVGSGLALDLERILQMRPDLVVAWRSGNSHAQVAQLEQLGIPVFESEPRDFETIAGSLERLAHLAGTDAIGKQAAEAFRKRLRQLRSTYAGRSPVRVFYQIWDKPLMTVNGRHLASKALRLCGGRNIFGDLSQLTPTVDLESVVNANPDAIIASGPAADHPFAAWRRFQMLNAVARNHLYLVDGNLLNRAGPRVLDGVEQLCTDLENARH